MKKSYVLACLAGLGMTAACGNKDNTSEPSSVAREELLAKDTTVIWYDKDHDQYVRGQCPSLSQLPGSSCSEILASDATQTENKVLDYYRSYKERLELKRKSTAKHIHFLGQLTMFFTEVRDAT